MDEWKADEWMNGWMKRNLPHWMWTKSWNLGEKNAVEKNAFEKYVVK